jgi:hypothetical protein
MRKKCTNDGIENKLFIFNPDEICPICGLKLNVYNYGQDVEYIYRCIQCRYMLRYFLGVVELRVFNWYGKINPTNKKTYHKKDIILKRYYQEIKKAKRRMEK